MKKKKLMIIAATIAVVIVAVVVVTQSSNWSNRSYEAVLQERVTMPDGEFRLIVKRTTEIRANPLHSLQIGEETKILDTVGKTISGEDLQPGIKVKVTIHPGFLQKSACLVATADPHPAFRHCSNKV